MDFRSAIWPDFRPEWILFQDQDLLVIDKPARVSVEAADPKRPDDVVTRLSRYLKANGEDPYLGIHQRLDRDTSGVLVYARQKSANASLATQFEKRTTQKIYLAAVQGYDGPDSQVLRHRLLPLARGRVELASKNDSRGKDAETRIRVLRRDNDRAVLSCELVTGRTHQIRVQLAAIGCPVAGDAMYGNVAAPRMLLHAAELSMLHPATGNAITFRAKEPLAFETWMLGVAEPWQNPEYLQAALRDAVEARFGLARTSLPEEETDAFRLVNEGGDGMPGLAVDVYGAHLVAQFYSEGANTHRDAILDSLHALGFAGVYAKFRPKQANTIVDSKREDFAPATPLRGEAAPARLTIHENGIPYFVRLGEGLSTGIFLDQRDNRARVRDGSAGLRVLNLFSYTCAFSSAALAGGAAHVTSVDASAELLAWGKENVTLLNDAASRHDIVDADVFELLERLAHGQKKYDLVIVDPPTYSTTKTSRFASGKDWRSLASLVFAVVAPGGRVLASSNDRRMPQAKFRRLLHEGARDARAHISQMKDLHTPRDFPVRAGEESHLKSVLITLER